VAIGSTAYVLGGRGAVAGTPTSRIVSISSRGRVRVAGRLPQALSDLAAVVSRGRIFVAGGRGRSGATGALTTMSLVAAAHPAAARRSHQTCARVKWWWRGRWWELGQRWQPAQRVGNPGLAPSRLPEH